MTEPSIAPTLGLKNPDAVWRRLKWTGLPLETRRNLMRHIRRWKAPGETEARKSLVPTVLSSQARATLVAMETDGFCHLTPDFAPDSSKIATELHRIYQDFRTRHETHAAAASKKTSFLRTIKGDADFLVHPAILNFVTGKNFLELAAAYLGEAPVLSGLRLWWSPVNSSAQSSQLFHFDEEDDRQIKFFLNCAAVELENGPFTLAAAGPSAAVAAETGSVHGRIPDELVAKHLRGQPPIPLTGPSGTLAAVDSSRCLHYGSRGNSADRIVLMFQFTRFSAPQGHQPNWGPGLCEFTAGKSPLARRVFLLT